jgi:hypothetical protein
MTRPPTPRARRGSILIALVVAFIVFTGAYVAFASAQVNHAKRVWADYGKLQATYAAESAVYESLVKNAAVSTKTMWTEGSNVVSYQATRTPVAAPTWITGRGTVVWRGETYTATVRGYQVGQQIMLWDFE